MAKHRFASDINVVPYIDVMLVLLVIFMVTAPMLTQGVKVNLPKTDSQVLTNDKDEPIIVSIKKDGSLYVNLGDKEKAKPMADIAKALQKVIKAKPATQVLVWGDKDIAYGKVMHLMSQLQGLGVAQVGLVTEPEA